MPFYTTEGYRFSFTVEYRKTNLQCFTASTVFETTVSPEYYRYFVSLQHFSGAVLPENYCKRNYRQIFYSADVSPIKHCGPLLQYTTNLISQLGTQPESKPESQQAVQLIGVKSASPQASKPASQPVSESTGCLIQMKKILAISCWLLSLVIYRSID